MGYLYTGTQQAASTQTGLSTQILVQVDGQGVGAIQTMGVAQSRGLQRVAEIGTDGVIELVPNSMTLVSITVNRIVFDKKRMTESFQRGFMNIHAQRIPFDILVFDFQQAQSNTDPTVGKANVPGLDLISSFDVGSDEEGIITHVYENCWFESLTTNYQASDYIVAEDATIQCEFVHSFKDGKQNVPASSGEPAIDDALEALADLGRRGSLDARGLGRISESFSELLNA
ncbi:MAG: hypothetical protein ACXABY_36740 [Candidatus Thorarchaeota archaeon]|jgi:hypothetical protein